MGTRVSRRPRLITTGFRCTRRFGSRVQELMQLNAGGPTSPDRGPRGPEEPKTLQGVVPSEIPVTSCGCRASVVLRTRVQPGVCSATSPCATFMGNISLSTWHRYPYDLMPLTPPYGPVPHVPHGHGQTPCMGSGHRFPWRACQRRSRR